jgi:hypothetical protein
MTEQEFIDYIAPYGTHVQFVYGDDTFQKTIHLTPYNSNYNYFPHIASNGKKYHMEFEINGENASIKECAQLITSYKRNSKLEELGI